MASVQTQAQNTTLVTLKNNNKSATLVLDRSKSWQGKPLSGSFPATIPPKGAVEFTYEKGNDPGSMAVVQYHGFNSKFEMLAVIVAWDAPGQYDPPNVPNRVYAFGSSQSTVSRMSWEEILLKLEKAKSASYNIYVKGGIEHKSPNSATLDVDIDLDWLSNQSS